MLSAAPAGGNGKCRSICARLDRLISRTACDGRRIELFADRQAAHRRGLATPVGAAAGVSQPLPLRRRGPLLLLGPLRPRLSVLLLHAGLVRLLPSRFRLLRLARPFALRAVVTSLRVDATMHLV